MIQASIVNSEMIPFSSVSQMADAFERSMEAIAESQSLLRNALEHLNEAFQPEDRFRSNAFDAKIQTSNYRSNGTEDIARAFKQNAWRILIARLGVQKVMSSARQKELDSVLYSNNLTDVDKLPDITAQGINDVIAGYCSSAEEFLEESIREEYDFFKSHSQWEKLKTNKKSQFRLDKKVIKGYMISRSWNRWETNWDRRRHLTSIDNIFHLLDGQGCIASGVHGPLVDAIHNSDGVGETEYFKFKCFKNGNLHLEFKRIDLLDRFNLICGRNRLGEQQ